MEMVNTPSSRENRLHTILVVRSSTAKPYWRALLRSLRLALLLQAFTVLTIFTTSLTIFGMLKSAIALLLQV